MKKVFWVIVGLLLFIYILFFSFIGNAIFKPIIQSQINKYSPVPLTLKTFSFGLTSVNIEIENSPRLIIKLNGSYNLFTQFVDLDLFVDANDISLFGEMVGVELAGEFETKAKILGKIFKELNIEVNSTIAKSNTYVKVVLNKLKAAQILANIKDIQLDELLAMIGQKPYIDGLLNIRADVDAEFGDVLAFNGDALVEINQGNFSQKYIKQDFDLDLPKTNFTIYLKALFDNDKAEHNFLFNSNIGQIKSAGNTMLKNIATNTNYDIDLNNLSAFTPLVGAKIRGEFRTNGDVKGDLDSMTIKGQSDFANSKTDYEVLLEKLALSKVKFNIDNMRVEKLLYMVFQPQYISGNVDSSAEIWDFDKGMSLKAINSFNGHLNEVAIAKDYVSLPANSTLSYNSKAELNKGVGIIDFTMTSNLATLSIPKMDLDVNKMSFHAPYKLNMPSLQKLTSAMDLKMVGKFEANGAASQKNDILNASFNTKSLGGEINAELKGDDLNAQISQVDSIAFLKMMTYPEVFSSKINGDLNFNTTTSKGTLRAILNDGRITKNQLTDALNKYANFDATGLVFNNVKLESNIALPNIESKLNMKSGDLSINADKILMNLDEGSILGTLNTAIKNDSIKVKLSEKISSPKVEIDASDLIKKKAGEVLEKEVGKLLNNEQKQQLNNLKNLFK